MIRLFPQSLSLRLFVVLAVALLLAQLLSAYLHFQDRGQILYHTAGADSAERIAGIVRLLDPLSPEERKRTVTALDMPPLRVRLDQPPWPEEDLSGLNDRANLMHRVLHTYLGKERPIRVMIHEVSSGRRFEQPDATMLHNQVHHRERGMHRRMTGPGVFLGGGVSFLTQVRLQDGAWVTFDHQLPEEVFAWPKKLMLSLAVLLISVIGVTLIAVRLLTRPLSQLSQAAHELGRDINRPPLVESGSIEVRNAARAFNTMQSRLVRFVQDRTRILAAVSHDLKTPITRMRLRVEMLEDDALQEKFCGDLKDMHTMVQSALDFMRGMDSDELSQPIDINALLESIQVDAAESGRNMNIEGRGYSPFYGRPLALKRCIHNLLENSFKYAGEASVKVEDGNERLAIRITDEGPGIPEAELEKVFEPFYRLEDSRSQETGGTGLGLSIARNIARSHGGELVLKNRAKGGLEAVLKLPR